MYSFVQIIAHSDGDYARFPTVLYGADESATSLIHGVVVGQVQVGDAVTSECAEPFRIATKYILLYGRCVDLGSGTFQVTHHDVAVGEDGINLRCEKTVDADDVDALPHPSVQQNIAGEGDGLRVN